MYLHFFFSVSGPVINKEFQFVRLFFWSLILVILSFFSNIDLPPFFILIYYYYFFKMQLNCTNVMELDGIFTFFSLSVFGAE